MPTSEIETLRRQLNAFADKYPEDPYLKERVGQIRENLLLLNHHSFIDSRELLKLCAMNVADLAEHVRTKRTPR